MSTTGENPGGAGGTEGTPSRPERTDDGGVILGFNNRKITFDTDKTKLLDGIGADGGVDLEAFVERIAKELSITNPWDTGYAQVVRKAYVEEINSEALLAWGFPILEIDFDEDANAVIVAEEGKAQEIFGTNYPDYPLYDAPDTNGGSSTEAA